MYDGSNLVLVASVSSRATRVTAGATCVSSGTSSVATSDVFVGNLGFVPFIVGGVFYHLTSAVGEKDEVLALGDISLAGFLMAEIVSGSSVFYVVFEVVVGGFLKNDTNFSSFEMCKPYLLYWTELLCY